MMKRKNLLVIGGLGYIGSILSDFAKSREYENVEIIDIGLHDITVAKAIKCDAVHIENIIDYADKPFPTRFFGGGFDIIWCADIDEPKFYDMGFAKNYVEKYVSAFVNIMGKCSGRKYYITDYKAEWTHELPENYGLFLKMMLNSCKATETKIVIPAITYGASIRMRWDNPVNIMIYSVLMHQSITLADGWMNNYPIVHVLDFVMAFLSDAVADEEWKQKQYCSANLTGIEVAHLIRHGFNNKEFSVDVIGEPNTVNRHKALFPTTVKREPEHGIEMAVSDIVKNIEAGRNDFDLSSPCYDNSEIFAAMIFAEKQLLKLGIIK